MAKTIPALLGTRLIGWKRKRSVKTEDDPLAYEFHFLHKNGETSIITFKVESDSDIQIETKMKSSFKDFLS